MWVEHLLLDANNALRKIYCSWQQGTEKHLWQLATRHSETFIAAGNRALTEHDVRPVRLVKEEAAGILHEEKIA